MFLRTTASLLLAALAVSCARAPRPEGSRAPAARQAPVTRTVAEGEESCTLTLHFDGLLLDCALPACPGPLVAALSTEAHVELQVAEGTNARLVARRPTPPLTLHLADLRRAGDALELLPSGSDAAATCRSTGQAAPTPDAPLPLSDLSVRRTGMGY